MTVNFAKKRPQFRLITWATVIILLFSVRGERTLAQQGRGAGSPQGPDKFVDGRVIVRFQPGANTDTVNSRINEVQATIDGEIPQLRIKILKLPNGKAADAVANAMSSRPGVEFAEVDGYVEPDNTPNDPGFSSEWHLNQIQAPTAWNTTTGSSSLTIAILDTGVDGTHPDLAGDMVPGWNFYDNNSNTADVYGHGTAVAGTASAISNNGVGVASVCWNCRIMPIRISDTSGITTYSTVANALTWAADHGARVANISYIMYPSSTVLSAAQYFQGKNGGGVVTISSGNTGAADASAATPYALVVGSTNGSDTLSSFSTTGNMIDLVAPGESIYTTTNGGGYGAWSGTSFSAPIVAGVAALVLSAQPGLTGPQVQNILENSADNLGPSGWDSGYGYGRVNAASAVALALTTSPGSTGGSTAPPTVSFVNPVGGNTISGMVSAQVSATDSVGVSSVSLSVDGSGVGTDTTSPYTFNVNTSNLANGSHTLTAAAKDASGNTASTSITVTVNNPLVVGNPVVSITTPSNGATVSPKNTIVSASASDKVAINSTQLYIDGKLVASSSTNSVSYHWNTRSAGAGAHQITATTHDVSGMSSSTSITVYR